MIATRRNIVAGALIFASLAISPAQAQAQDKPTEIRIGTQKGGFFPAVRQRRTVEDAFKPLGIEIKWVDFQFGPPLLEAINVGSRRLRFRRRFPADLRPGRWREDTIRGRRQI